VERKRCHGCRKPVSAHLQTIISHCGPSSLPSLAGPRCPNFGEFGDCQRPTAIRAMLPLPPRILSPVQIFWQKLGHPFLYNAPANRLWSLQSWRGLTRIVLIVATARFLNWAPGDETTSRDDPTADTTGRCRWFPSRLRDWKAGGAPPIFEKRLEARD
jgi:hypothetical protein